LIVVPAIDLREGRVVRLLRGRIEDTVVYTDSPAEAACRWEREGALRLHVVDLDAAVLGRPQLDAVAEIIAAVSIPIEVGGGVRTIDRAEDYIGRGAERVIFGTAALLAPAVVQEAVRRWPGSVAVALDARDGRVAVSGWTELTDVAALDLARQVRDWGVGRIQYTDISRDGALSGPNVVATEAVARLGGLSITASGGVSSVEDLRELHRLEPLGVDEVIVGKALYEGRLTFAAAREAAR
jgi:phosphoribosylformimino-5-aminoimidazole carboxamide ribotide isomerase